MFNWLKSKKKSWYKPNYPKTVKEVLDDNIDYKEGTHQAIKRFKVTKPYRGTKSEMQGKFRQLCDDLSKIYEIETPQIAFVKEFNPSSVYFPVGNLIVLREQFNHTYSVVVFLHEYGHALKKDERETCRWSINLYRKHFPKSFAKLKTSDREGTGHLLFNPKSPLAE